MDEILDLIETVSEVIPTYSFVEHLCEFHLRESTLENWENSELIFLYLVLDVLIFVSKYCY